MVMASNKAVQKDLIVLDFEAIEKVLLPANEYFLVVNDINDEKESE